MTDLKPSTAFQLAFIEWRDSVLMKKKSHKSRFLLSCNNAILESAGSATPEAIMEGIAMIESKNAQKFGAKTTKKILGPVVDVLKDYYGVIDTCCQADPFPTAIIWGSLKVIIDGLGRYFELFDKIRSQLHMLKFQLERLKWFDDLWGDSDDMQRYLCSTYVHVFRFWSAVDKECDRISVSALMRATTSFSVKKVQAIIDDLSAEVDKVDKLGPIVEARVARGERQNSEEERRLAGLERMENRRERKEAAQFRETVLIEQDAVQQERFYSDMSRWLESRATNKANIKRHHDNIDNRFGNTCDWLLTSSWYEEWMKDSDGDPILWLHAQPGSGKSTICSHAMAHVESLPYAPAVAYQFFHFDEQTTARQLLYNVAAQLFEQYWLRNKTIPENLRVHATNATDDYQNVRTLIHSLIPELPKVFIFLDGLDEEDSGARQKEALKILDFVIELTKLFPGSVRFWLSSQDRAIFRNRLQSNITVDIQDQINTAVRQYLCEALPGLCDLKLDEGTQSWALKELQQRADGHFLWATLMIKEITRSIPSISHLKSFIKNGLPLDLYGYYSRILDRYHAGPERVYAAKILSLVVFARRRLTVHEIIEAIWITSTDIDQKGDQIFINFIKKLFAPLVVIDYDEKDSNNDLCRLFHSTAKLFLINHPNILKGAAAQDDSKLLISEYVIASACLAYLRQPRYSDLLHNSSTELEEWKTRDGDNIVNQHLLRYSSKYWDKHLDEVEETPALRLDIEQFLRSPNFVTTLQLQSLFVELHFGVYTLVGMSSRYKWLKRVFPKWFSSREVLNSGKPGAQFVKDHRAFVSEWRYFLHRPTCSPACRIMPYAGEIDRCLWGTLDPNSFLASNRSRYESFMLANELASKRRLSRKKSRISVDGFAPDGRELALIHYAFKGTSKELNFQIENWTVSPGSPPSLEWQGRVSFDPEKCHWPLYSTVTYGNRSMVPVKFASDLKSLRIGSKILSRQKSDEYIEVLGANTVDDSIPWYFEEFAARGDYVVLVSRQKPPNSASFSSKDIKAEGDEESAHEEDGNSEESDLPPTPSVSSKESSEKSSKEKQAAISNTSSDSDDDSSSGGSSDDDSETHDVVSDSSISLELDSGDEDWSDGSTDLENLGFPSIDEDIEEESTESEKSTSKSSSSSDSETDEEHPSGGQTGFMDSDSDRDVDFDEDEDRAYRSESDGPAFHRITKSGTPKGTITILDNSKEPPKQMFQYSHPLPVMLYDSPPVLHPSKPLVVWPLCGGEILFADFVAKSYFIRKSRTTSRHTRHVFMKPHFSTDGAYLHLASLEAQELPVPKAPKAKRKEEDHKGEEKPTKKEKPRLQLSLFVTTHRLSQRKTTRSPPNLVHRAKLSIGSFSSISVAQMPLSLTWAPNHLYCTVSGNMLQVYRVELFNNISPIVSKTVGASVLASDPSINIKVPKNDLLLPDSSRVREVHYYPPSHDIGQGTILIGSLNPAAHRRIKEMAVNESKGHSEELPDVTSPPIGLFVKEGDLGEWVSEEGREEELKGRRGRGGGLERNVERFDAEDDCDIEIYLS